MANPLAHIETTSKEIFEDTDGKVDIFVAGIGTGGTATGVAKGLKDLKSSVKVYGVEPLESPLLTEGKAGPHKIQGIGANFVPKNFDRNVVDKIVPVKDAGDHITDPVVKEIFDAAQEASSIQLWYDQYLPTSVASAHLDGLQEVFGLTKTPQEAQEEMQTAMDEYLSTKSDSSAADDTEEAADDTAEEATDDAAAEEAAE